MEQEVSDVLVGLMMGLFALVGLFLAAGATDSEMYLFGLSLFGFGVCFGFGLIRKHYDRLDAAAAAREAETILPVEPRLEPEVEQAREPAYV